jgi:hypothetical protein
MASPLWGILQRGYDPLGGHWTYKDHALDIRFAPFSVLLDEVTANRNQTFIGVNVQCLSATDQGERAIVLFSD